MWIGLGTVMNLRGNYFPFSVSPSPTVADIRAMYADFGVVGRDIVVAMDEYERKIEKAETS